MRALAPLPAFLLLAASAAACPFGFTGHVHAFVESAAAPVPMPEGRCTGGSAPPSPKSAPSDETAYDLRASPIPAADRPYWEMMGYRFDDAAARLHDPKGAVVTRADMAALNTPFDAASERLDAVLWQGFVLSGYRLDEQRCRLVGPDAQPMTKLTMLVWRESSRRQQAHAALETILGKLRGLDPSSPVPPELRDAMVEIGKAGTELPPAISALLKRATINVQELRAPAAASYVESTKFFDGHRTLSHAAVSAVPASRPGVSSRRKGIVDPHERTLGRVLNAAFGAELAKTAPGRELLARFRGPKGEDFPDVMVLKLTQQPNDPRAPGAVYDASADRMIINHWVVARVVHSRLSPEKARAIGARLNDAKELVKLLAEDPTLLPLVVDDTDIMYFHELTHAAQSRRDRVDDEILRGNLPGANPAPKEHEAHRAHCGYLLSKSAEAVARSGWREYCLDMLRDPDAFKDRITGGYRARFAGSATLDDVFSRQEARRETARSIESGAGLANWLKQRLKQFGFGQGDVELAKYRIDVHTREKEFLASLPELRREAGGALVAHYESQGRVDLAFILAKTLPPGSLAGGEVRIEGLAGRAVLWIGRDRDAAGRSARLDVVGKLSAFYKERGLPWPAVVTDAYQRDARSVAEDHLAQALKAAPAERDELLKRAEVWTAELRAPGDLPSRIARARPRSK